jgi:uncharacterized protein YqhQ
MLATIRITGVAVYLQEQLTAPATGDDCSNRIPLNDDMSTTTERLSVGGQAVIEGVMMRAPERIATAIRKPDNEILIKTTPYVTISKRHRLLNVPVLRGAISFFEMLIIGIRALNFSADVALREEQRRDKGDQWQRSTTRKLTDNLLLAGSIVLALAGAIAIFFALPLVLTELTGLSRNALSFNMIAGVIRVAFFLFYLWAISKWKEIGRIFEYHGAEHKSIFAFESGEEVTIQNARKYTTHHPRCGTSFLLIVVIMAILLFAVADTLVELAIGHRPTLGQRFLTHFSLLPLLGGVSYELLKLSGKKQDAPLVRWLSAPGLWLQKITTREPDDAQLEVAIAALKGALEGTNHSAQPLAHPSAGREP